jgi:WD40 repeat protein/DNA-binding SARP family transcriptional activator
MDFHILGSLEVIAEGRVVTVSGSKQQALLALFLLHANETLSTDRLVEELWGRRPPATAAKTLQVHVSRLRKTLANGNGSDGLLVTRDHGYQLKLDPERLDAYRFERLVAEGRAELAAGRAERAAVTLERALSMWRGPALGDFGYEPFAEREAARLGELRIGAIEELIDAKLALGRHAEVLGEVDGLIAEHPYRERLRAQKMLALYRSDRQADALQVYQDTRIRLVQDLGIEPGERLRRLEQAVLAQDPALALPPPSPPELPPELRADTLLAGRDEELRRLREQWRRARSGTGRLVLLMGPHGIGKTRLAAELGAEVSEEGGDVVYESGDGAAERITEQGAHSSPRLVVLDDTDDLGSLAGALDGVAVLVVATATRRLPGAHVKLELAPLDTAAVRAIASEYAGDLPVERLAAASGSNPRRVHQLARAWAHEATTRRLGASTARAREERASLRSTEADVAADVVALRSLDDRPSSEIVACPFKGLAFFDVEDADVFFGRDRLVAELVARLAGAPLLGIVGPSGSGKSSALRAGLLAALKAGVLPGSERRHLRLLRPGERPLEAHGDAPLSGTTIVAVDQFEETFTTCRNDDERAAFVERLVAYAHDPRAVVIVALRADFYGRCATYPEFARLLAANHVLVGQMRRDELRSAIESPARRAGLTVDPELVDALLADVEGEPGALPLLSTTLLELWRHRDGRRLQFAAYEHSGGVHGAVARLAESAYARLDDEQRELARRMLLRLAGEGQGDAVVRRLVDVAELVDEHDAAGAEVLAVLADSRLVTLSEGQAEVAHEALLREWPRLRGWLDEDAQGRRVHRHLSLAAREWEARGRDPGDLYRGARLASVLDWRTAHDAELNDAERTFVTASRLASDRSHRRLRIVLGGVAALLVVAVVAGLVALGQRGKARDEALAADAQRLGASALVQSDLGRALLVARQAVALDDTVQTRGNLLATLLKSPAAIGVMRARGDERFLSVALSPDGRMLAAGDEFGRLVLFDVPSRRPVARLEPVGDNAIFDLVYSPDGRYLALSAGSPSSAVTVLDTRGYKFASTLSIEGEVGLMRFEDHGVITVQVAETPPPLPTKTYLERFDVQSGRLLPGRVEVSDHLAFAWPVADGRRLVIAGDDGTTIRDASGRHLIRRFAQAVNTDNEWSGASPDGRTLAFGGFEGTLRLMDLQTGEVRPASGRHTAPVGDIAFTADGRRMITSGDEGAVIVWDVDEGAATETFTGHGGPARALAVSDDGTTVYSAGLDGSVFVWDLTGTRRLGRPFDAGPGYPAFPRYALSGDGRLLAHGRGDGKVTIVDTRTLEQLRSFPVTTTERVPKLDGRRMPEVLGMRFLPRSHLLAVGGFGGFLAIVDADSGRIRTRLRGHTGAIYTPGISADGRLMITGSSDGTIHTWSLPDGRELGGPVMTVPEMVDAQLSPDGRWIVAADMSNAFRIFDARTHRLARRARGREGLFFARFSPDGRLVVVGDVHGRADIWSAKTWKPITRPFAAHTGVVSLTEISPDGRTLATGGTDGTVRLWDIEAQQPIGAPLPGLAGRDVIPIWMPDGSGLIAAYETGQAYRWDIRASSLIRQACEVAGRRLTRAEWEEFLPGREFAPAC